MITPEEIRKLEDQAEANGTSKIELMENAGQALFDFIVNKFDLVNLEIVIYTSHGNNGGDGFVLARKLSEAGHKTRVIFLGTEEKLTRESKPNYERITDLIETGLSNLGTEVILVDAMLGTGMEGEPREPIRSAINHFNDSYGIKIAVDIPTGLDPLTGEGTLKTEPDFIVTFHDMKTGLKGMEEKTTIKDIGLTFK